MTTFGALTRRNGAHWPGKDAFVEIDRKVTWGELNRRTDALGHAYRALGVSHGDRVAVLSHDAIEVPETFLAAAKVGAIRVGLNPRLAAAEIAALIRDCEPRLLLYSGEHQHLVGLATSQLRDVRTPPLLVGFAAGHGASFDYEDLIARHGRDGVLEQTPHEHVMIAYTSGSTGLPKGAIYPHDKFLRTILYTAMNEGLVHDSVWLQAMPAAGVPMMHSQNEAIRSINDQWDSFYNAMLNKEVHDLFWSYVRSEEPFTSVVCSSAVFAMPVTSS